MAFAIGAGLVEQPLSYILPECVLSIEHNRVRVAAHGAGFLRGDIAGSAAQVLLR
jgi:hypothetical protein